MPQTKPLMWTTMMLSLSLLMMIIMAKMFQKNNMKMMKPLKMKKKIMLTKW